MFSRAFIRVFTLPYKRQGKASNGVESAISLVWRSSVCEETNRGLKISVTKIYRITV